MVALGGVLGGDVDGGVVLGDGLGAAAGVGSVLTFLPQILILFAFMAVLEDCGYMARAAFLMDRLMARAGLNGKSFIPLLSSVACAVPGIMSARVIENRRDRLATILVAPLMSCSARLPVYALLIGAFLSEKRGYGFRLIRGSRSVQRSFEQAGVIEMLPFQEDDDIAAARLGAIAQRSLDACEQ